MRGSEERVQRLLAVVQTEDCSPEEPAEIDCAAVRGVREGARTDQAAKPKIKRATEGRERMHRQFTEGCDHQIDALFGGFILVSILRHFTALLSFLVPFGFDLIRSFYSFFDSNSDVLAGRAVNGQIFFGSILI